MSGLSCVRVRRIAETTKPPRRVAQGRGWSRREGREGLLDAVVVGVGREREELLQGDDDLLDAFGDEAPGGVAVPRSCDLSEEERTDVLAVEAGDLGSLVGAVDDAPGVDGVRFGAAEVLRAASAR